VSCRFQIVNHLSFFSSGEPLNGFQFNHHGIKADEVRTKLICQSNSLVESRNMNLALEGNIPLEKLMLECLLINRFQKSATELPLDFHRSTDGGMRPGVSICNIRHTYAASFTSVPGP